MGMDFSHLKQMRDERIEKNPERLRHACKLLEENDIEYEVKNETIAQINVKVDGKTYVFYAGTGKIMHHEMRGIRNFIKLIKKKKGDFK